MDKKRIGRIYIRMVRIFQKVSWFIVLPLLVLILITNTLTKFLVYLILFSVNWILLLNNFKHFDIFNGMYERWLK